MGPGTATWKARSSHASSEKDCSRGRCLGILGMSQVYASSPVLSSMYTTPTLPTGTKEF
jgi:hypothetical protein